MKVKLILPKEMNTLSSREADVLKLLLKGFSNKKIALELLVCEKTIEKHLTQIYAKIGVASRAEAIIWFMKR